MCLDLRGNRDRACIHTFFRRTCRRSGQGDRHRRSARGLCRRVGVDRDGACALQHTINCLVGPKGDSFDAKQLNPCKDFGDGAIPDTKDASKLKSLGAALGLAEAGLKSDDLDTAKKQAAQAAAEIKEAE